ncbi:MAG: biotin-dependent carboxyltransferase family protein [Gemmatimonadaceae bacterium]|nr:biotin-dependent carboxyltransferase family protein [Gemmatimonadaceae bacterium]
MIRVLRAGAYTTVQDRGRRGWQRDGVPVGGAMDDAALRLANALVNNPPNAAVLEATLRGPTLAFEVDSYVAITGADMDARIDDRRLATWWAAPIRAGQTLTLDMSRAGCRSYIAIQGGIDVPVVLGSRSTYVRAALGGLDGRALKRGDMLSVMSPGAEGPSLSRGIDIRHLDLQREVVRMIDGPHLERLDRTSRRALFSAPFAMRPESDRMGLRLAGPRLILASGDEPLSAGVAVGSVQLPPSGDPIVLMADRQTIGGYPRLGDVATVDLPILAQMRPGESIRFEQVGAAEAEVLYLAREHEMERIELFLR